MDIPVGRFVWFDYLTHDIDKAQKFFAQLFGWTSLTMTMGATKYPLITVGDRHIGGYGAPLPGTPIFRYSDPYARWLPYLQITNAHDAASRVKTLGGKMIKEPYPFGDLARMAIASDPGGQVFAVWQPLQSAGDQTWAGPPGTFCWAELYSDNPSAAVTMLKQLAGFTETKSQLPDSPYWLLEKDGAARAGIRRPMPNVPAGWFAWVRVASCDATVAKAQQLGAEVHVPPTPMGAQRMALITDPFGAALGIMQG